MAIVALGSRADASLVLVVQMQRLFFRVLAGALTRWTGWLLIIGAVLGLLGGIAAVQIIFALGAGVTGAGFAWLGWELLSGGGEEAQQPTTQVSCSTEETLSRQFGA